MARLNLAAVAGPDPVRPSGNVTYQLTVVNPGTLPLTGAKLQMTIPTGSSGASCTMDGGTRISGGGGCSAGTIYEWDFGTVSAGGSATVSPTIFVGSSVTAPLVTSVRAVGDAVDEATATVTTIVDATAPLQLAIADGSDPAAAGDVLGYTITFGNRGTASLPSATLTATVPPGTVLDPASVTDGGMVAGGVITWTLGNLNPGGVGQRTFSVTIADLGAGETGIRQTTAEAHDTTLPQPTSARASAVTLVEPTPVLQLVLDTTLDPVQRGDYVNYALTATNLGTVPLTGVTLRLKIPNGSSGGSCLVDGGKFIEGVGFCAGSAVYEWTLGTLAAGASASVNPSIQSSSSLTAGSLLPTIARVVDDSGRSARAAISPIVDTSAPLQLTIADGPDPAAAGEVVGYTITFTNRGAASLPSATLTTTVPPNTVLDPASVSDGGMVAGGVITWPLGNLSPGAVGQRTFSVTVADLGAAELGTRQTTAELHDSTLPQPISARAGAITVVEATPILQLVLDTTLDPVQRGTYINYELTATNLGTAPLTGVTLRLKIPNGSSGGSCLVDRGKFIEGAGFCASSAVYEWTLGTLGAGASASVNPSIQTSSSLPAGSLLPTIARVVDDSGRSARAAISTIVDTSPPLQLAIVDGPDPAAAGDALGYTITFGNRGTVSLPSATLTAIVPPGTTLNAASVTDGGTVAGGVITWPLGNLAPAATGQRTFTVTVTDLGPDEPGTRQTTAELHDTTLPQPTSARANAVTVVEEVPALQLVLRTTLDPVQRGTVVGYQLTATNLGTAPLTGVTMRLKIPNGSSGGSCVVDGGTFIEGAGFCAASAVYEWTIGPLAAGASVTKNPSVQTASTLSPGALLTTIARVVDDGGRSARAAIATRITQ